MTTREVSYNLSGCVRNMSLPVAGTTILLYDYWSTAHGLIRHYLTEQITSGKGEFNFDVRKGIYSVEVVPNRDTRFARQSIDPIKVTNNTTISVSLKHGAIFNGTVRTHAGDSVADCELIFFGIEPEPVRASEPADQQGKFSVSLPKGKYYVGCRLAPDTSSSATKPGTFLCPTLQVIELYNDLRQDILLPELVRFQGVVSNPQGHPVADVAVTLKASQAADSQQPEDFSVEGTCFTNKKGEFECLMEPGNYDVKLEPGPESHLSERTVSSILVDQARTRTYSLGAGYRLSGTITFEDKPVENALVTAYGGKISSSVLTKADGTYDFALSGGSYELSVTAQPDSLARLPFRLLAPFTCTVNLAEDMQKDVVLSKGLALSGKVNDGDGKPRAGVQLAIFKEKPTAADALGDSDRALMFGITGDDGSYDFRLSGGKYWLVINNQRSTAQPLEVQAEDLQNDLTWHSGCLISFEIVSEFDEPVPNCRVVGLPYDAATTEGEDIAPGVSDDNGVCRLSLPAGIYSFQFQPPEHGSFASKHMRQLSINCDLHRKIKLSPKAALA